jgi:hypothetical protein
VSPSKKYRLAQETGGELPPSAEERQLQERYAYLNRVMRMDKEERKKELKELSRRCLNKTQEDPEERARLNAFTDKLERESKYPTAAIQTQILERLDGLERGGAEPSAELRQQLLSN